MAIKIDGAKVATIKITRVQPKFSIGKVVSGDYELIETAAILRKAQRGTTGRSTRSYIKTTKKELTPGSSDKPIKW